MAGVSLGDASRPFKTRDEMKKRWVHFLRARAGATAIEYALVAALLSVVAITGVHTLGSKVKSNFAYINNAIN